MIVHFLESKLIEFHCSSNYAKLQADHKAYDAIIIFGRSCSVCIYQRHVARQNSLKLYWLLHPLQFM